MYVIRTVGFPALLAVAIVLCVQAQTLSLQAEGSDPVKIPQAKPPTIDGTISEKEWKNASVHELGEAKVRLKHDRKNLYVAMETPSPAIGTIFVHVGDRIHVLHTSARLGRAVYKRSGEAWELEKGFEYKTPSDEYWKAEHWKASTMSPQRSALEFAISIEKLLVPDKSARAGKTISLPRMAFVPWMPGQAVKTLPGALKDGCENTQLLMGHTPQTLIFETDDWLDAVLAPKPKK